MEEEPLDLTAEEFDRWLPPRQAINALAGMGSIFFIVDALNERVKSGLVRVAVETIESSKAPNSLSRCIINPAVWQWAMPHAQHAFWSISDVQFTAEPHTHRARNLRFYGVRFEPAGIEEVLRASGLTPSETLKVEQDAPPRKTRHGLPPLRDELLREWLTLFHRAYPAGSKQIAERSALGMFPEHSVDRQKVRDLIGDTGRGRPRKIKDNH